MMTRTGSPLSEQKGFSRKAEAFRTAYVFLVLQSVDVDGQGIE